MNPTLPNLAALSLSMLPLAAASAQTTPPPGPPPAHPAAASGGINDKLVNNPIASWAVYGPNQKTTVLDKDGPKGYPATRIAVSAKGAHPYDVGAIMPLTKPIAAGDVVFVAMYLRAPEIKDGEKMEMPFLGVTGSSAPYATIAGDRAAITNQWAQYFAVGTADKAYVAGGAQATVHLAGDRHVVEVGPVRIFDLGENADVSRLPKNQ